MSLLTEDQLKEWTGFKRRAELIMFLRRNAIPFHYGKSACVITTQAAVDHSLAPVQNKRPRSYTS